MKSEVPSRRDFHAIGMISRSERIHVRILLRGKIIRSCFVCGMPHPLHPHGSDVAPHMHYWSRLYIIPILAKHRSCNLGIISCSAIKNQDKVALQRSIEAVLRFNRVRKIRIRKARCLSFPRSPPLGMPISLVPLGGEPLSPQFRGFVLLTARFSYDSRPEFCVFVA